MTAFLISFGVAFVACFVAAMDAVCEQLGVTPPDRRVYRNLISGKRAA